MCIFAIDNGGIVARILNQQRIKREAQESARRAAEQEAAQIRPPGSYDDNVSPQQPAKGAEAPLHLSPHRSDSKPKPDEAMILRPENPTKDRAGKGRKSLSPF